MTTTKTPLRTISANDLKVILEDHLLWLSSCGTEGKRANLFGAYLSGADLSGADLDDVNLSGVNLRNADLSNAYLGSADLSRANLSGANLSGANLNRADLSNACLEGANISGAYLSGADLSGAIVSEPWKIVDGKLVQTSLAATLQTPKDVATTQSIEISPPAGTVELTGAIRQHNAELEAAVKLTQIEHELAFKALASLEGGEHIVNALRLEAASRLKQIIGQ